MSTTAKATQYLQRYAESEARCISDHPTADSYDQCLIIPAYAESADLLGRWAVLEQAGCSILVILILNRPDNCTRDNPNSTLRAAICALPTVPQQPGVGQLHRLFANTDILLVERAAALPADEGVGLARKIGADIAIALQATDRLRSRWLHCTDADATLPPDYFRQSSNQPDQVSAICHPFTHSQHSSATAIAMQLYELRLHYYVMGLRQAESPYAFHTLGSCLSIDGRAYQQVRGFPRRAAAEDFYLLNKLAKLMPVIAATGAPIQLDSRPSQRVPFGTGPAVAALAAEQQPLQHTLFYHPTSFRALGAILRTVPALYSSAEPVQVLASALQDFAGAAQVLQQLGLTKCLQHCQTHSADSDSFSKHFQQWFDGFRSLKFIHGMRTAGYRDLSLHDSLQLADRIWPAAAAEDWSLQHLLRACTAEQGWVSSQTTKAADAGYPPADRLADS